MIKKIILAAVLMIVLAFNAAAYVDVTRHFNQNRVDYALYTCLDPECAQVSATPFSDSAQATLSPETPPPRTKTLLPMLLNKAYEITIPF